MILLPISYLVITSKEIRTFLNLDLAKGLTQGFSLQEYQYQFLSHKMLQSQKDYPKHSSLAFINRNLNLLEVQ